MVSDPSAFLRYPLLVLSLPSLTFAGMTLSAAVVWLYLRRRQMPILPTLDAFAPCGAVLAAFLELGHLLDGSEPGMPVFAGVGDKVTRLVPISLYGVVLSLGLCVGLWALLERKGWRAGQVAAIGLMAGGAIAFGLDMLSLPLEIASDGWLEPGQWVALGSILAGGLLWTLSPGRNDVEGARPDRETRGDARNAVEKHDSQREAPANGQA